MFDKISVSHHIQKHIIDVLMYTQTARFRDLRPPKVDTNLFTYHLKGLLKIGLIEKGEAGGYTLSSAGLSYVDRISTEKKSIRTQPKIINMLVIQNSDGDILLQKRTKQPYIDTWTLPYGKLHVEDRTVEKAAQREAFEKLGLENPELEHAGDAYIRVMMDGSLLSTTLAHVFRAYRDYEIKRDDLVWARPHKLSDYRLSPAVEEIMTRTFFKDPHYFEEFEVEWRQD
jgi:ADP-ribose pyrophosphatase YjhB (NUDIX family)